MSNQSPKQISYQDVETVYWDLLKLADRISNTVWSRSIPDKDFRRINIIESSVRQIANDLFIKSHEMGGDR
jgi:hypothetical protein